MEHDDDTRTSQEPGGGTDAEGEGSRAPGTGSRGGPGHRAPGGGMTVGSGDVGPDDPDPPSVSDEAARAGTGDVPAQDAASADVDEASSSGNEGIGEAGTSGPAG
jgi:hypothetical protein